MMIRLAIALAVMLIVAAFASWAFLPARYLPGNRARHLRIRRPGYGHLAATLAPCWGAHDLCLYTLDIAASAPSPSSARPGCSTAPPPT
jgi:hypothetical protein